MLDFSFAWYEELLEGGPSPFLRTGVGDGYHVRQCFRQQGVVLRRSLCGDDGEDRLWFHSGFKRSPLGGGAEVSPLIPECLKTLLTKEYLNLSRCTFRSLRKSRGPSISDRNSWPRQGRKTAKRKELMWKQQWLTAQGEEMARPHEVFLGLLKTIVALREWTI